MEIVHSCYDNFELILYLSNRLDLSKGLEGASSRLSIVCQVMMQICGCKIDDLSKSVSRVSVPDGCVQSPQAIGLCADLDVCAQWVSNQLLTLQLSIENLEAPTVAQQLASPSQKVLW